MQDGTAAWVVDDITDESGNNCDVGIPDFSGTTIDCC